jgi:hypothetical protein
MEDTRIHFDNSSLGSYLQLYWPTAGMPNIHFEKEQSKEISLVHQTLCGCAATMSIDSFMH